MGVNIRKEDNIRAPSLILKKIIGSFVGEKRA